MASKAQLFQDSNGNLHISSAANQSVFVNDMDVVGNAVNMAERIIQLEAANKALATTNAALLLHIAAINDTTSISDAKADLLARRLAVLEAIAASNPGSLANSTASPATTAGPRTTTLPPAHTVNNGSRVWTKILGSQNPDYGYGVAVDSSDFVYLTGTSMATSSYKFDGQYSAGSDDLIALRLTPDGTSLWLKFFGTSGSDRGNAIATDSANNVYVAGNVAGSLDGNPYAGKNDFVVVKLNNNGVRKWSRQVGSSELESANAVGVDMDDNVVAAGYTTGDVAGNTNAGAAGSTDILIVKYNGNGDLLWLRQFGSNSSDPAVGLTIDSANNIFVTGYTYGRLVEDADAGADTAASTSTTADIFVAKYDKDGTRLWIRQLGSDEDDQCLGIAVDSTGNIYLACYSEGNFDGFLNVGLQDTYVIKFDPSGTKLWTRRLATTADDYAYAIAVDSNDFVYVAGYTHGGLEGNTNLGTGAGTGTSDVFVAQYDSSGMLRWLQQYGSDNHDHARGIAVDSNNAVYVTGRTIANAAGIDGVRGVGGYDIFLTKFV